MNPFFLFVGVAVEIGNWTPRVVSDRGKGVVRGRCAVTDVGMASIGGFTFQINQGQEGYQVSGC